MRVSIYTKREIKKRGSAMMSKTQILSLRYSARSYGLRWLSWLCCLFLIGIAYNVSAQDQYESLRMLKASEILPPDSLSGPNHRIEEKVINDGYINSYKISSRFGTFEAISNAKLKKRINEINAIAVMVELKKTDEYTESLEKAGKDTLKGIKNLITHPVSAAKGAVTGVGKLFKRTGESLFGSKRSKAEESRIKDLIGFSKTKREYAREFGVDVYSSNQVLQEHLDEIAWAGYGGGFTMTIAKALVPGGFGVAISASEGTRLLNEMIAITPPVDLRMTNRKKLKAMKIGRDIIDLFMDNTVFTPRQQTLIVFALESMKGTKNRGLFLKLAIKTHEEDIAFFRQRMAVMYAGYHRNVEKIGRFVPLGEFVAARTMKGELVLNFPLDHLVWTETNMRIFEVINERADALAKGKEKHLWLTGTMTPLARKQIIRKGWKLHEKSETQLLAVK